MTVSMHLSPVGYCAPCLDELIELVSAEKRNSIRIRIGRDIPGFQNSL